MIFGAFDEARKINFPRLKATQQIVRWKIDKAHLIGFVEEAVRDGFLYRYSRHGSNHVVETFEMLDVHRTIDIDPDIENVFNVLPTFRMTRSGRIAVRKLVDHDKRRPAADDGINIERFRKKCPTANIGACKDVETVQKRLGISTAVCIDPADENIKSFAAFFMRLGQHGIRFTNTGSRPEKEFQAAPDALLSDLEKAVWVGASVFVRVHGG